VTKEKSFIALAHGGNQGQNQKHPARRCWDRGTEGRAVWTLVGAAHLADAEDVERRCIEGPDEEPLRPERLQDDGLAGPGQVGHWEVATDLKSVVVVAIIVADVVIVVDVIIVSESICLKFSQCQTFNA